MFLISRKTVGPISSAASCGITSLRRSSIRFGSGYLPQEVFAAVLAAELRILIGQGYRYIFITNGHGAPAQLETIRRLCVELSNTTEAKLDSCLTLLEDLLNRGIAGHAGIVETSLMMHYDSGCVDLNTLPERNVPIRYLDYSIVDGAGFNPDYKPEHYDPEHIVKHNPRDADAEKGRKWFEQCVEETTTKIESLL